MKTFFLTLIAVAAALFVPLNTAAAAANCQPVYGGGETCVEAPNLSVNKLVRNPVTGQYVDNLGVNDPKFTPGQSVPFRIVVTNTGNAAMTNIALKDIFPQYVDFEAGAGTFDSTNKTLTATIDKLEPGASRTFDFTGKVMTADKIQNGQGVTCLVNQAQATHNKATSQDNAQFCIQKDVLGVTPGTTKGGQPAQPGTTTKGGLPIEQKPDAKKTPDTGPEALALFALIPSGIGGLLLRRKAK